MVTWFALPAFWASASFAGMALEFADAGPAFTDGARAIAAGTRSPPPQNDGLDCGGRLVILGDSKATLLSKCGHPTHEEVECYGHPYGMRYCAEIWTYRLDSGSFPRRVTLLRGVVWSIVAQSRFASAMGAPQRIPQTRHSH